MRFRFERHSRRYDGGRKRTAHLGNAVKREAGAGLLVLRLVDAHHFRAFVAHRLRGDRRAWPRHRRGGGKRRFLGEKPQYGSEEEQEGQPMFHGKIMILVRSGVNLFR